MKNYCYELGKILYDKIDPKRELRFANEVNSINDLRRSVAHLKGLDPETSGRVVNLLEEIERNYHGKSLFSQVDDIKRNLEGVLALLLKVKGEEVPLEEGVEAV